MGWTLSANTDPSLGVFTPGGGGGGGGSPTPPTSTYGGLAKSFFGVQAPSTTDYDGSIGNGLTPGFATVTGLTTPAVGFYNSIKGSSGYISYPQSTFDHYLNLSSVQIVQWTLQMQDTSASDSSSDPNFNLDSIIAGNQDVPFTNMMNGVAATAAAFPNKQIEIRLLHEGDGNWYPWGCLNGNNNNTPAKWKAAWTRLYNIGRPIVPSNVFFIICFDSYGSTTSSIIDPAMPDSSLYDLLGCDAYNFGPSTLGAHGWRQASTMLSSTKTWAISMGKPFVICETAAPFAPAGSFTTSAGADDNTGDKNVWIANFATYLAGWPKLADGTSQLLRGFYWEQNQNKGNCRVNRVRQLDTYQFPNPNSYHATTGVNYVDHSAAAFTTAFTGWQ